MNKNLLLKPSLSLSLMGLFILGGLLQANLMAGYSQKNSQLANEGASVEVSPNGAKHISSPNGAEIDVSPDGTKTIKTPDHTIIEVKPDGSKIITRPDGTIIQKNKDGSKLITKPDGTTKKIGSEEL